MVPFSLRIRQPDSITSLKQPVATLEPVRHTIDILYYLM